MGRLGKSEGHFPLFIQENYCFPRHSQQETLHSISRAKMGQVAQLAAKESERCAFLSEHLCPFEQNQGSVRKEDRAEMDTQLAKYSYPLNKVSVLKEPAFGGHIDLDIFTLVWSRKQLACVLERPLSPLSPSVEAMSCAPHWAWHTVEAQSIFIGTKGRSL